MTDKNKSIAVIIGGSGGIGSALARRLVASGWRVTITGRDPGRLQAAATATGAQPCTLDASDPKAVEDLLQEASSQHGRVDAVANCAGSILLKAAHLTTDQEFSATIAANLNTSFNLLRAAARVMMKQPTGGSIVFCSSVAARRGLANHEAIAAAKAGVEGLAIAAAASYARYHIRINCVAPGLTRTPLTRGLTENESIARASAAMHPLGRIGEPDDVASAMAWLMDPAQSWITGNVMPVDGGLGRVQSRT